LEVGDDVFDQWDETRVRSIYPSLIMKQELVKQRAVYSQSVCSWNKPDSSRYGKVSSDFIEPTHSKAVLYCFCAFSMPICSPLICTFLLKLLGLYAPFTVSSGSLPFVL
jgi:hypothetical protein